MIDILLVSVPFSRGTCPSYSLGVMKSLLRENGYTVEVLNAHLYFKRMIGPELYDKLALFFYNNETIEFIFASSAFPSLQEKHKAFEDILLKDSVPIHKEIVMSRKKVKEYISLISGIISKKAPRLIWFDYFLKELTASIAINNAVKESIDTVSILGNRNYYISENKTILGIAPSFDYVFSGEPENKLVELCNSIFGNNHNNEFLKNRYINCGIIADINSLPYPDFSDYFEQSLNLFLPYDNNISFESSRGCSWGEKSQCIFCGYNPHRLKYRAKNPERIIHELTTIIEKYKPEGIIADDLILPEILIDYIMDKNISIPVDDFFYEIKPSLSFNKLKKLKELGITTCEAGIETLNDNLLQIMKKGITVCQNIQFLRNCRTLDITALWNFLYAIPGETKEDYLQILDLIPSIIHLQPPFDILKIEVLRLSPMYRNAGKYNIGNLRPFSQLKKIFPDNTNYDDLSMAFSCEYDYAFEEQNLKEKFFSTIIRWQNLWKSGRVPIFKMTLNSDGIYIYDSRDSEKIQQYKIDKNHEYLINYLNCPVQEKDLMELIYRRKLESFYKDILEWNCLLKAGNKIISLLTR